MLNFRHLAEKVRDFADTIESLEAFAEMLGGLSPPLQLGEKPRKKVKGINRKGIDFDSDAQTPTEGREICPEELIQPVEASNSVSTSFETNTALIPPYPSRGNDDEKDEL